MSTIEDYSGLCGIVPTFAHSGNRIRCTYEFGHGGPCSFKKYEKHFHFHAGSFSAPPLPEEGFELSVLSSLRFNHGLIYIDDNDEVHVRK